MTIYNTIAHQRGELLSNSTHKNIQDRRERLYAGQIGILNRWVDQLRKRTGESIPYFDPAAASDGARVLMLLQDPSNAADSESGFISLHNNDGTANNVYKSCMNSGLSYSNYLPWNVVPWKVGDNRDLESEARRARPYLLEFLALLDPAPEVVILMGNHARDAWRAAEVGRGNTAFAHLEPPLWCPHPSPRVYDTVNRRSGRLTRDMVTETFAEAAQRIAGKGHATTTLTPAQHRTRRRTDPPATAEQVHIHDLFRTGKPLRIRAGAGTGKTTTLIQLADILGQQDRAGLYIAFNKSIATEAQSKFPSHIRCSTAHALAYRGILNTRHAPLLDKMRTGKRVPISQTQIELNILAANVIGYDGRTRKLSGYQIARHTSRTIDEFCKTANETITPQHVPTMPGLSTAGHRQLVDIVLPYAHQGWTDLTDPHGRALAFGHGHYLKLWALTHPRIGRDGAALFLDEAQDTSPVLASIIAEQNHLQRVVVGDSAQAIYRFTGAASFMTDDAIPGSLEGRLTQSWRFGQAVADEANHLLARIGDDMRLSGNPGITSRIDHALANPDVVLTRTNGRAIEHVMAGQRAGRKVHLIGDHRYAIAFCESAELLRSGKRAAADDLTAFSSWPQVVQYAADSPDAADWKVLVKLIETHGVPTLRRALEHTADEQQADMVVATAHKAKGREWGRVILDDDLAVAVEKADEGHDPAQLRDELMLGYVAVTRAQHALNPGRLIPIPGRYPQQVSIPDKFAASHRFLDALDRMEGLGTLDEIIESVIQEERIPDSDAIRKQLANELDDLDDDPRISWMWVEEQWVAAGGRNPADKAQRNTQLDALAALPPTSASDDETRNLLQATAGKALIHISIPRLTQLCKEISLAHDDPNPSTADPEIESARETTNHESKHTPLDNAPAIPEKASDPKNAPHPQSIPQSNANDAESNSHAKSTPDQNAWNAALTRRTIKPGPTKEHSFTQHNPQLAPNPDTERINEHEHDATEPSSAPDAANTDRHSRFTERLTRAGAAIARHALTPTLGAKWRGRSRPLD